jgi:signal transduction histidine kinase
MGITIYLTHAEQTTEGNRARLQIAAIDAPEISALLAEASAKQRQIVLKYLSVPSFQPDEDSFFTIDFTPERVRQLQFDTLVQWVESGKRYSKDGQALGSAPAHWLAFLAKEQTSEIFSEPIDSGMLSKSLSDFGVETLMIRIDANRGVAILSPTRLFTDFEFWRIAALGLLTTWFVVLVLLIVIALPFVYWIAKRQARRVASPLSALSANAERWAIGAVDVETQPSNISEIQLLSERFQSMAQSWNSARQEQQNTQRALEHSIAKQREFVADISHDLRTPLAAVMGYTERLQRKLPAEADLAVIAREASALNRLTTQLFELAQGDSRTVSNAVRPIAHACDIHQLLVDVIATFKEIAWQLGIVVRHAPPEIGVPAIGIMDARLDMDRLALALRNLLDNAIRHTHPGGLIEIEATCVAETLRLSVRDNGEGIAPELLPHIFERGVRGDAARTTRGGGLGLSIVQQIAEQHDGSVNVESTLGQGASFEMVLKI